MLTSSSEDSTLFGNSLLPGVSLWKSETPAHVYLPPRLRFACLIALHTLSKCVSVLARPGPVRLFARALAPRHASVWVCVLSCVLTFSSRSRSPHQDPEASLCLPAKNDCISWTPWRQGTAKCHLDPLQSDERKTGRGEWRKMEMGG